MELLIIKSNQNYIRFKDGNYLIVELDKASVFPFDHIEQVKKHETSLKQNGFKDIHIKKLILTEEDL